ncbi:uncharacterized protein L969DRAFT_75161 [Mixia osmundae IAM 14324]|uniref:uncharacterized protein n=1 Tax=Mixia osmundae (strain CBS 9802 / IAM 14324 / JCM 22182 / KY 12970) TaxID=764103 RepID=UPI0004A5482A|nr:uncharacterized protein L969DRAFT_75161 [Mixia osmundae IAM 14324]KEI39745.1 hypothetical protein L969DRAFT_75161 [Mixia osmundae IAM 14324]
MEVPRKRPLLEGANASIGQGSPNKRPALSASNSYQAGLLERSRSDSHAPEDVGSGGDLEAFQKEALHRALLHYKRLALRHLDELLLTRQRLLEAQSDSTHTHSAWDALLSEIASTLQSSGVGMPSSSKLGSRPARDPLIYDTSSNDSALILAELEERAEKRREQDLQAKLSQTKVLMLHLLTTAPSQSDAKLDDRVAQLQERSLLLASQAQHANAKLAILREEFAQLRNSLETTQASLQNAETQLDRAKSRTVASVFASTDDAVAAPPTAASSSHQSNGSPTGSPTHARANGTNGNRSSPAPFADHVQLITERDEANRIAAMRAAELDAMRKERIRLKEEVDDLNRKFKHLPDTAIRESPAFQDIEAELRSLRKAKEKIKEDSELTQIMSSKIRESQESWKAEVLQEASKHTQTYKERLIESDRNLARVRRDREDIKAELHELRTKEAEKMRQVDHIRILANSRHDRILAYGSLVARLRMQIAADNSDLPAVERAANEVDLLDTLEVAQKELAEAKATVASMQGDSMPDATNTSYPEARTSEELLNLRKRIKELEDLYADAPDGATLAQRLEDKQREIAKLEIQLKSQQTASSMLVSEIERLSAAWQALDEQNRSKVLDMVNYEDRLGKAAADKAKADNRYFAAMREKEAVAQDRDFVTRLKDKQAISLKELADSQAALSTRLSDAEDEITMAERKVRQYEAKLIEHNKLNAELIRRKDTFDKRVADVRIAPALFRHAERFRAAHGAIERANSSI